MLKENKRKLIVTSLIIMLPILVGLLLWSRLPDTIATHFGAGGEPDGWSSKPAAVLGLPLFILAIHWVCILCTATDPKRKNISGKALGLLFWVCPLISIFCSSIVYAMALGVTLDVTFLVFLFCGVIFIVIGNYLPKCKQNYTVGIKLPWALYDEENWNHTHRFAGRLWVACGVLIIATSFLESVRIFFGLILFMVIVPVIDSYIYYRRHT